MPENQTISDRIKEFRDSKNIKPRVFERRQKALIKKQKPSEINTFRGFFN